VSVLLFDLLRESARRFPDKLAAVFAGASPPDDRITFAELDRRSDRVASRLRAHGIGPGDRVAILHGNSLPGLCWFWGILKAGAQTVDVPALAGRSTIQAILDEARPRAIAMDGESSSKQIGGAGSLRLPPLVLGTEATRDVVAPHGLEVETLEAVLADRVAEWVASGVEPDDVAMIVYTSGTTGRPNGVMLSHTNFVANLTAANERMGLASDDSILVVVPLHYIHGRMQLLYHALIGGTVVFSTGFAFPAKVVDELGTFGTTGFSGVPYHFKQLLDRTSLASAPPPGLRYVLVTGGALSPAELRGLQQALPSVEIHLAYGQTEAAPRITWAGPEDLSNKPGSVGRALPNVVLEILGPDERAVDPGVVGEVAVSGPNIMKGYVAGDERDLGKIDQEGRLRTGDLGWLDSDGHLFLVGRSSEMIKSAGERIFPQEIEAVLRTHPRVREVAVVGIPDPVLGEKMVACVELTPGGPVDAAEFRAHCLQSLPFVRIPKTFELVQELPKTGSGKVARGVLKKRILESSR
jgi:long-chain acyl-CoA synthetase